MDSSSIMLNLGGFKFSISTAAYNELVSSTGFEWAEQPRIGRLPALQFTGYGAPTRTLRGAIYPHQAKNARQVQELRTLAAQAKPVSLSTGVGDYLGQWVVEKVDDTQSALMADGAPRKIDFSISIKKYTP